MIKNVITIATGKQLYIDLAINLYHSFIYHHPTSDINFIIVTDREDLIRTIISKNLKIIKIREGELGEGFSPKLHLDKLAPEGQTLFVDSDCLIFGKLDYVFEMFRGKSVSVIGSYVNRGEWFGNISEICRKFNVPHLPKFNGGIYYIEKGEIATKVYQDARDLETNYDEIGFVRLRNRPNDEVIMALAMQLNNQTLVLDDGTVMSDPQACPGGYHIDVIKGERWLVNPAPPSPLHQSWYPFERVSPVIFHFLGYFTEQHPYKREVYRLSLKLENRLNFFAEVKAWMFIDLSSRTKILLKNTFRPIYHLLFGARKPQTSNRL